jgi:SAM-dependent methyltransferase
LSIETFTGAMDSLLITKLVLILSLLIAAGAAALFILFMLSFVLGGAPFVPTPSRVLHRMIELADIKPGEKVYDLGCGDGRLVIEANKKHHARAVGIEISPLAYLLARLRAFASGADVTFILGNFLDYNISDADVVFCYLLEGHMKKLQDKFKTLKKDCRIVCHQFEIPGWEPQVRLRVEGRSYVAAVFKYEV